MKNLPVCSVVTEKTIDEFELLKTSIEQYHDCTWFLSCDDVTYKKYNNTKNIVLLKLIETDDCDHNIGSPQQKDVWMRVMMTKFDAVNEAIKNFGHALFLDSDMIFVNEIEKSVLNLFENKDVDALICQHMTNNWQVEAQHGLYNAGMFHIKNVEFLNQWSALSRDYKKHNFYFEQQPLEYVQRNFLSLNLPINYNIGWWRFNNPTTRSRLDLLDVLEDKITFGKLPAINFHVHTFKKNNYENFGKFLVDKMIELFKQTNNDNYKKLANLMT
jgi:hypothetical protein